MSQTDGPSGAPEGSPYTRHIPALDGIRGLAILMVMGSHLFSGNPHNLVQRFINTNLAFGATGVDLFFVLSGFLITGILFDSQSDLHFFRKFYARRALRILPLYYGVIAIYMVLGWVQHLSSHRELFSLALYLQNTNLIAVPILLYHGALQLPLAHFWSLAIEEQFYLVWPLLVFLMSTRARLLGICAASIFLCPLLRFTLWLHGWGYFAVHASTICRADALLIGGALALLLRGRYHDRTLSWAPWLALAVIAILIIRFADSTRTAAFPHDPFSIANLSLSYTALAFGYAGLIAWSLVDSPARYIFNLKPMRLLGRYSYGLYVLHLILLFYLMEPIRSALQALHVGKGMSVLLSGLIGFALSVIVAVISYHFYERKFLKLKRFFDYRPHGNTVL